MIETRRLMKRKRTTPSSTEWLSSCFPHTCYTCNTRQPLKKPKVGTPIISLGFLTRVQVDLIDIMMLTCTCNVDSLTPHFYIVKVKSKQGTEAIRSQIKPSQPKGEITKITNSQNTKRIYGQPREQLFPKRWPLSTLNRTKKYMNTRKVKRHRNSDTKNRPEEPEQNYCIGTVSRQQIK